jgi:hypothetical protein
MLMSVPRKYVRWRLLLAYCTTRISIFTTSCLQHFADSKLCDRQAAE